MTSKLLSIVNLFLHCLSYFMHLH